jgi:MFS transporter, DHA1 family, inner membrane transport protein
LWLETKGDRLRDRCILLAASLSLYIFGHAAMLFASSFQSVLVARLSMISAAAIFTPQAAATIALLVPLEKRATSLSFVFSGWAMGVAVGMPVMTVIADHWGWRIVAGLLFLISFAATLGVLRTVPKNIKVARIHIADWLSIPRSPVLVLLLLTTIISSAGHFVFLPYITAELKRIAGLGAEDIALVRLCSGFAGVFGNHLMIRLWAGSGHPMATGLPCSRW